MLITITETDLATLQDHGSVALITGTNEDGQRVQFAVEPRYLDDIGNALVFGEESEVDVEIEGWQIYGQPVDIGGGETD